MNMRTAVLTTLTTAVALAALSLPTAPDATAVPGDPSPGCVNFGMFNSALLCDGPIREDGSWQRCSTWQQSYVPGSPGGYAPGGRKCEVVTPETSTNGFWGAPPENVHDQ